MMIEKKFILMFENLYLVVHQNFKKNSISKVSVFKLFNKLDTKQLFFKLFIQVFILICLGSDSYRRGRSITLKFVNHPICT